MKLITKTIRSFLALAALNDSTIQEYPALSDIIYVRDESDPKDLILLNQNKSSVEFAVAPSLPNTKLVATHVLSLEKTRFDQDCLMLSYYDGDDNLVNIARVVVEVAKDDKDSDKAKLLHCFNRLCCEQISTNV